MNHARWCPPVISWFIIPLTIDISPINHSYWSYKPTERYRTGAPPCVNAKFYLIPRHGSVTPFQGAAACGSGDDSVQPLPGVDVPGQSLINHLGMDQYLLIPFLVGWTSIYQLLWCSPGVQGFDTLPFEIPIFSKGSSSFSSWNILTWYELKRVGGVPNFQTHPCLEFRRLCGLWRGCHVEQNTRGRPSKRKIMVLYLPASVSWLLRIMIVLKASSLPTLTFPCASSR